DATGNIDTTGATFTMTGSQSGDGGDMNFDADGSVILGGKIQLRGDAADDFGGSSGEIDASAGADIRITATQLDLTGAPDGEGGNAFFDADGDIIQSAAIAASGNGREGIGGHIEFTARHNLTLDAINVSADGGSGDIDGEGFCSLTVPAGRVLEALGPMGTIRLASRGVPPGGGRLTVAGTLQATESNMLETLFQPPITAGATITPAATITTNPILTPCGGLPQCGDGTLQVNEPCDGTLGA